MMPHPPQVAKGLLDSGRRAQLPQFPVVSLKSAAPLAACSQLLHYRSACDASCKVPRLNNIEAMQLQL
jgi:hypothetical protein